VRDCSGSIVYDVLVSSFVILPRVGHNLLKTLLL
jgi:hypothetical protein